MTKKNREKNDNYCGVHLPDELFETVKEHAKIFGRSLSGEIRVMIRDTIRARGLEEFEFSKPKKQPTKGD